MFYYESIEYFENTSGIGAGIENKHTTFDVTVYPTPSSDVVHISIKGKETAVKSMELMSLNGQLIKHIKGYQDVISLENIEPGMYQLRISDNNGGETTIKITKN
jgi:hypothetical protein